MEPQVLRRLPNRLRRWATPSTIRRNPFSLRCALFLTLAGISLLTACNEAGPQGDLSFWKALATSAARNRLDQTDRPTIDSARLVLTLLAPTPTTEEESSVLPTGPAELTATPLPAGKDAAAFVDDVTVPDGTVFAPGEAFEKVWRIANSGSTTWTEDYALVHVDGDLLGAPTSVPLGRVVPPGGEAEVRVPMIAPQLPGTYIGYWKMKNAAGEVFGFGLVGTQTIWVKIVVSESATPAPTPTPPGPLSAFILEIENPQFQGVCPHTFALRATFALDRPMTLTFGLEAGEVSGTLFYLPLPETRHFSSGTHTVSYALTLAESASGWLRLRVSAPLELASPPAYFALVCR